MGAAAVRTFAKRGWRCIATGRRQERLDELVAEFGNGVVLPLCFDVSDDAARTAAIASIPAPFGEIDLLINNAGAALGRLPAQECDPAQWRQMIDTNATAVVMLTRDLLPKLIERRGAIINVTSVTAIHAYSGSNVYGATKAFVRQFTAGLRADLHGKGVRVCELSPGMTETEFTLVRFGGDQDAHEKQYGGTKPLSGQDIAETMFWIANLPEHINVSELQIMPVSQSPAGFQIARDE